MHYDPTGELEAFDNEQDVWRVHGRMMAKHHRQPRRRLYVPEAADGAPPDERITGCRFTVAKMPDGSYRSILDDWRHSQDREPWDHSWTGRTYFFTGVHKSNFPLSMEAIGPGTLPTWDTKKIAPADSKASEMFQTTLVKDGSHDRSNFCDTDQDKDSDPASDPESHEGSVNPSASAPLSSVNSWLVDTGCGHDLVGKRDLGKHAGHIKKSANPIVFATANGAVPSYDSIKMKVPELGETVQPWVLKSSPAVLSVGARCMENGYSFVWPAGSVPYFVLPSGEYLLLEVRDCIPYLKRGMAPTTITPPSLMARIGKAAPGVETPLEGAPAEEDPAEEAEVAETPDAEAPAEEEEGFVPAVEDGGAVDIGALAGPDEADRVLPPSARASLRAVANSVHHALHHHPSSPYCISCCYGKMRSGKKYKGLSLIHI